MPIDRKLIVGEVESQPILFLALKSRETCFLAILAWMLELRLCPFPFHAPIVSKGLPEIGKRLFRSTLRGFVDPRKLLALDLVVFRTESSHGDSFALGTCFFPSSQRPVESVSSDTTGFAEVGILFWCDVESDHMRAIHGLFLLQCSVFEHVPIGAQTMQSSRENGHNGYQVPN